MGQVDDDRLQRQRLGKQARDAAVQHILDKYREEFEKRVERERLDRGLPRNANAKTPEQIEEQLRRIRERASALELELRAARGNGGRRR